jgi:putative flavoprotein involved in K+ transport
LVVWATGFRSDWSWVDVPEVVVDGAVRHRRGVTEVPGLYFIGLPWQHSRGSALLGFVQHDAAFLADQVAARPRVPVG